jgi:hypothetical protein
MTLQISKLKAKLQFMWHERGQFTSGMAPIISILNKNWRAREVKRKEKQLFACVLVNVCVCVIAVVCVNMCGMYVHVYMLVGVCMCVCV